ncbi:hypothetical protein [Anaerotignum sp.]|uniref:hypothetical protein n=1 Tax=Anaerotignum sp. TaxID=2039241 RepID=UPI00289A4197|nr:hypothetical protein [Anaerotignum sp.]
MADFTANYNLEKPAQSDFYNVEVQNKNMDKIDAAIVEARNDPQLSVDIEKLQREMLQVAKKYIALNSRIDRLEDAVFSNITGNPYLVSCDSLNGITVVKGVWNSVQQRIEC